MLLSTLLLCTANGPDLGAPTALDDAYTTPLDENLSQDDPGVLENDTDPEGDPLSAQLISSAGANGVLFLYADGSFEYEPASTGTDTFTYRASDGTSLSNLATITFTVTPATSGSSVYSDEASFHRDLMSSGLQRFQESFEDDVVWDSTRTTGASSVTHLGVTWSSNYPENDIRTGSGPAAAGNYGFFSLPHGNYLAGPQCLTPNVCTDGFQGTSAQPLVAIGGSVRGAGNGGRLEIILDGDPARTYDMGSLLGPSNFFGIIDPTGFQTFEFRETEGTAEDAFYVFADHFIFAFDGVLTSGAFVHGCGGNPVGSLKVLSGTARLGTRVTVGLDNPLGTQAPGAASLLFLSTTPDLAYPCGSRLGASGMNWPGSPGELLVSILAAHKLVVLTGAPWSGMGSPAAVHIDIPNLAVLAGLPLHAQGALIDGTQPANFRLGLTEAVEWVIAP